MAKEPEEKLEETSEIEEPVEEETTEEEGEETPEEEPKEEEKEPDYKKKYVESSREALVIRAKDKQTREAISEAAKIDTVTEDELKAEYSDWDDLSPTQQKIARENLISSKRFALLNKANEGFKDLDEWNKKVDEFADDPKSLVDNPQLEGRMDEFKVFASKPSRRNVDFEDLISAFLFNLESTKPTKKKGAMFEPGTGGPQKESKDKDKLSIEEAAKLKKTNYSEYKRLLMADKISEEL